MTCPLEPPKCFGCAISMPFLLYIDVFYDSVTNLYAKVVRLMNRYSHNTPLPMIPSLPSNKSSHQSLLRHLQPVSRPYRRRVLTCFSLRIWIQRKQFFPCLILVLRRPSSLMESPELMKCSLRSKHSQVLQSLKPVEPAGSTHWSALCHKLRSKSST